ncbi:MAG TPA: GNAT family N-acetyltransferase [Steroidobacteraceae bacterium]|nr:GNAT family N-acetyltransferase [Steroidobacteraceae bacterium]
MDELNATECAGTFTAETPGPIPLGERESLASHSVELTTDIVIDIEGIRALKPDYEHLYRVTGNTLPFALQDWHLTWCAHFLNRNPQIQEQPLFHVLRNSAGESVAIVPLIHARRRLGPLRLATLGLIGSDPGLTEIRSLLVKPSYERQTVRAVHKSLAKVRDWDWIQWSGISGAMAEAVAHEVTPRWHEASEDYVLDLPPSWEEFRGGLKRNVRESLRHCYNSLRRDGHSFELVVAREPAEVLQALERFFELHELRANMARGPKHPNCFAGRSLKDFFRDVCQSLAGRDAVRIFQLKIGTEIVASRVGFVVGDGLYLYYSGFDPAWARYSVMTTTVAEAFRYAIANGLTSANLSLTREQSKLRWRPRLVEVHSALVQREHLSSRIACRAYRVAMSGNGAPGRLLKSLFWAHRDWS